MRVENYIYSKTFDYFLVLPMKTASTTATWVFTYFDFCTYSRVFSEDGNFKEIPNPAISMLHSFYVPPEIEAPKIIITTRNPYHKTLSNFLFRWKKDEMPTPIDFENFIINAIEHNDHTLTFPDNINPTHIIQMENVYEDYLKIPFVKNSKLNSTGILQEFLEKNINQNLIKVDKDKFLTEKNKEMIYSFLTNQFEIFGYQK